ncbi:hypothetical protein [Helcococcus kunzii]|uniref:hypothetical protein n=1 Tax=Helcococcus kunzii TaxID=40091 RepID=UPI0024AE6EA3|nr:hypothetical protein [Helcococcus kunzii]
MLKFLKTFNMKKILLLISLYLLTYILLEIFTFIFTKFNIDIMYQRIMSIFIFALLASVYTIKGAYKKLLVSKTILLTIGFTIVLILISYISSILNFYGQKNFVNYLDNSFFLIRVLFIFSVLLYYDKNFN